MTEGLDVVVQIFWGKRKSLGLMSVVRVAQSLRLGGLLVGAVPMLLIITWP